jgi:hypothetical protein
MIRVVVYLSGIFALSALSAMIFRLMLGGSAQEYKWVLHLISFCLGFGALEIARRARKNNQ